MNSQDSTSIPSVNLESTTNSFRNPLAEFVFYRTYSRWNPQLQRRETFPEMVERVLSFYKESCSALTTEEADTIRELMLSLDVMPSMRLAWTAGPPARQCSIGAYNCSYLPIDSINAFGEVMYLLMHGTGVGFSVEQNVIESLPEVAETKDSGGINVIFEDSKEGWATGLIVYLQALWDGYEVRYDVSKVRPEGAPLNTFGGRASGPQPLVQVLEFAKKIVRKAVGRKLRPIEVHDIVCQIASSIVVGGVRRSALISLSDLHDSEMSTAKMGEFWATDPQRSLANNSAVYLGTPEERVFWQEWSTLIASNSGERGIYNRFAALSKSPARRKLQQDNAIKLGTNPCAEILLRPRQFCNLTSVVVRPEDTRETLVRKVWAASIMGTIQASLDNFSLLADLNPLWEKNAKEERILGVSLSGVMDHPTLRQDVETLQILRNTAVETNRLFAERIGIAPAAAVSCIKPEGTSSTVNDSAPGFHARYAPYYLRHVRINATDPLYRMMRDQGVEFIPEVGQGHLDADQVKTWVCAFPVKAPPGAVTIGELSSIDQLEIWRTLNNNWAEHSVSATVSVDQAEWGKTGAWVYDHFHEITGLSFLPRSNHVYQLAPYVPISEEEYHKAVEAFPTLDYNLLSRYEYEDHNQGVQTEWACSGGSCDIL